MMLLDYYFPLCNITAFLLCCVDKVRAKQHRWRVPEETLLLLAAIGGSAGLLLGMLLLRHKTKHKKFIFLVPVLLAAQIAVYWVLLK